MECRFVCLIGVLFDGGGVRCSGAVEMSLPRRRLLWRRYEFGLKRGEAGRSECGCFKVTVAVRKGVLGGQNNFVKNNWSTIFFQIKKIF